MEDIVYGGLQKRILNRLLVSTTCQYQTAIYLLAGEEEKEDKNCYTYPIYFKSLIAYYAKKLSHN